MTTRYCPACSAPRHPVFHQGDHSTYGPALYIALARDGIARDSRVRAGFFAKKARRLWPDNLEVAQACADVARAFPSLGALL